MSKNLVINATVTRGGHSGEQPLLQEFLRSHFTNATLENHGSMYSAIASLEKKTPDEQASVSAVVMHDYLDVCSDFGDPERSPLKGRLIESIESAQGRDKGFAAITYIARTFNLNADTQFWLYTYLNDFAKQPPEELTGIITPTGTRGKFRAIKTENVPAIKL